MLLGGWLWEREPFRQDSVFKICSVFLYQSTICASSAGKLVGDVLLAAAFVSYAGPFNMAFRKALVSEKWLPDLIERSIPLTQGVVPLDMLAPDIMKAKWINEGLQTDPLSVENGAIMTNASRWSLMIDPQLQVCRLLPFCFS